MSIGLAKPVWTRDWTTEKPTQPGYYWAWIGGPVLCEIVATDESEALVRNPGQMNVFWLGSCIHDKLDTVIDVDQWLGPIETPEGIPRNEISISVDARRTKRVRHRVQCV